MRPIAISNELLYKTVLVLLTMTMIFSRCRASVVACYHGGSVWMHRRPTASHMRQLYVFHSLHRGGGKTCLPMKRCLSTVTQAYIMDGANRIHSPQRVSTVMEGSRGSSSSDNVEQALTRTAVRRMRVAELRNELEQRGLDTSGVREELVSRMLNAIDQPTPASSSGVDGETTTAADSMLNPNHTYKLFFSGRNQVAQGISGTGMVMYDADEGREVWSARQFFPEQNSGFEASYVALLTGLKYAVRHGVRKLDVQCDNEVIYRQLRGEYKVQKDRLKKLYWAAMQLIESFDTFKSSQIGTVDNRTAADLARQALGTKKSFGVDFIMEPRSEKGVSEGTSSSDWSQTEKVLEISPDETYLLRVDGGARGNPGIAGAGMVLYDSKGEEIWCGWKFLGESSTNNCAEYSALLLGLQCASSLGISRLRVETDSQLAVRHINGLYKVKDERLRVFCNDVLDELDRFAWAEVTHIPRVENKRADELANQAMDMQGYYGFEEI